MQKGFCNIQHIINFQFPLSWTYFASTHFAITFKNIGYIVEAFHLRKEVFACFTPP